MAGILDYFQNTMQSPLFLSGASLLTGGGMGGAIQGMQAGLQFQDHARRRATEDEQNKAYQGLLADPNIPQQILPVLRASQPSDGLKLAAEYLDPSRGLEAEYKRAQIAKLKRDTVTGGVETPSSVREWQYYSSLPPEKQQQYINMKRAEKYLDLGTSFVRPNQSDPSAPPTATYQKDVAGKAQQQEMGKAQGQATVNLPQARYNAAKLVQMVDGVLNDPYLDNMTGPVAGRLPNISGASARVQSKLDQIQGKTFLQAYNDLRGGGQITEVEGAKAESSLQRLQATKQGTADYVAALHEFRQDVLDLAKLAEQKASGNYHAQPQVTVPDGHTDMGDGFSYQRVE